VFHATTVNIPFDDEPWGQMKRRPAAENRCAALLRVGAPEGSAADLTENNRPTVLRGCWRRDKKREAQHRSAQTACHASKCAKRRRKGSLRGERATCLRLNGTDISSWFRSSEGSSPDVEVCLRQTRRPGHPCTSLAPQKSAHGRHGRAHGCS
jgi:hypothetical protein